MSLEANRFLNRLYGEAAIENKSLDEQIIKKIKMNKIADYIEKTKDITIKDYLLFKKKINNILYEISNIINLEDNKNLFELVANLISEWNNLVSVLTKIKYQYLEPKTHQKLYDEIKEIKPSLVLLSNKIDNIGLVDNKYVNISDRIKLIINEIDEDIYSQITYPLAEIIQNVDD